jgi:uncharacterized protein
MSTCSLSPIRGGDSIRAAMENATPPSSTPPPSQPLPSPTTPDPDRHRAWDMWCHLSALAGLLPIPFGNLLGPLIVWQLKRTEFASVDEHGKESLNFQISAAIYFLAVGAITAATWVFCIGVLFVPVLLVIHFGAIILAVIAGIKANDGVSYRYPLNLRLIK